MNAAQQRMLEKFGNNILMIYSAHGTNPYQIQLTALMVVDGDYEGFPVALLWSKLQTENIFRKNFACLKEQVPVFMSQLFYQLSGGCCEKWVDGKKRRLFLRKLVTGQGSEQPARRSLKLSGIHRSLQTKLRSVNPEKARMNIHLNW
jgi:hypothetical protein